MRALQFGTTELQSGADSIAVAKMVCPESICQVTIIFPMKTAPTTPPVRHVHHLLLDLSKKGAVCRNRHLSTNVTYYIYIHIRIYTYIPTRMFVSQKELKAIPDYTLCWSIVIVDFQDM